MADKIKTNKINIRELGSCHHEGMVPSSVVMVRSSIISPLTSHLISSLTSYLPLPQASPIMPKNKVRDRLVYLCEKVVFDREIDISQDPETEGHVGSESLSAYNIRLLDLDLESLDHEQTYLTSDPPILFKPLASAAVEMFPPTETMREYRDYIPPEARSLDNRRWWQPIDCARDVYNSILDLCDGFQTNLPEPFFSLTQYCRLDTIT